MFNKVLKSLNIVKDISQQVQNSIIDIKMFKLYRSEEMYDQTGGSTNRSCTTYTNHFDRCGQLYSLRDLLDKT